ncbi:HD-GYP domain-containing protein [Clostridium estertheticum]|uniref:HD-GYP domain-containing protein n=1 Tax=Clostridium estertheticum TaxID=238834 RepID=UPI001C7D1F19|nr:HD-GYP domain-containing protein [Clostridium estertheticum]MBX4269377.1 HD-GYP domain-containing protein [Clostridium estertheticum]WLC79279.1 HD-GYP domain-containing protein [Clostridium estertheticum]
MEKRCIPILECELGEIIAQKVVSKYGSTIVVENTTINSYIKNKLIAFEVDYIWIYGVCIGEYIKYKDNDLHQLKQSYNRNILEIKKIVNDLTNGNNVSIEKIDLVSNSIYEPINNEYHVVRCLNELKSMDEDTFTHSINVSLYAMLLGKWMLLPESKIKDLIQAALLHDVGKTKISNSILNKKGKLEIEEFEEIKKHPIYSFEIIKGIDGLSMESKEAVLKHHEREDKSGYPAGIGGSEMSICSKIIAITNFYASITSERTYRKRVHPFEAFKIFQSQSSVSFDIHIVNTFLSNIAACYVGTKVLLNNGKIGEIVYVPPQAITKPIVCVDSKYLDLSKEINLSIVNML